MFFKAPVLQYAIFSSQHQLYLKIAHAPFLMTFYKMVSSNERKKSLVISFRKVLKSHKLISTTHVKSGIHYEDTTSH